MFNTFAGLLKATLCGKSTPVFFWREQGQIRAVSAANLWTMALHRRHELRSRGLKPHEICYSSALDFNLIIDLVACGISGNPFFPCRVVSNPAEQEKNIASMVWNSSDQSLRLTLSDCSTKADSPALILRESDTNTITKIHAEKLLDQVFSTLDALRPSADEIRLSSLKPHNTAVLINDVLCGMMARQAIYVDFQGKSFQHTEILHKTIQQEEISTLAIDSHTHRHLAMAPIRIKEQFNLTTVYSVETLEIY
jgi:hypothetical protein